MLTNLGTPAYLRETPSQTAGPYVHIGLAPDAAGLESTVEALGRCIADADVPGTRIRVEGVVTDGTGTPLRDVLIEVWQADAEGRHAHPEDGGTAPGFRGWGRIVPDFETGAWSFETVKPGAVPARGTEGWRSAETRAPSEEARDAHGRAHEGLRRQAPHISFWLVARGINVGLQTRMYFGDEAEANAADPVLALVEQPARRATLVADAREGDDGMPCYRFPIRLQGENETVFLDV